MKLNRLETHDRYSHLQKDQWEIISHGAEMCLKTHPVSLSIQGKMPYVYLFAHPRAVDFQEQLDYAIDAQAKPPTTRMLWQPRVSRPCPQENSYCFRAKSMSDLIEVCWLLPPREVWGQYKPGNVTESDLVMWSINQFQNNLESLARPHPEDLSEDRQRQIFVDVVRSQKRYKPILNLPSGI